MNPVLTSVLTTLAGSAAGAVMSWAAKNNIISADQIEPLKASLGSYLVTASGGAAIVVLAWWKGRQHTRSALVDAVNSPAVPGVKVVRESSPSPTVVVTDRGLVQTIPPAPAPADMKPEIK